MSITCLSVVRTECVIFTLDFFDLAAGQLTITISVIPSFILFIRISPCEFSVAFIIVLKGIVIVLVRSNYLEPSFGHSCAILRAVEITPVGRGRRVSRTTCSDRPFRNHNTPAVKSILFAIDGLSFDILAVSAVVAFLFTICLKVEPEIPFFFVIIVIRNSYFLPAGLHGAVVPLAQIIHSLVIPFII